MEDLEGLQNSTETSFTQYLLPQWLFFFRLIFPLKMKKKPFLFFLPGKLTKLLGDFAGGPKHKTGPRANSGARFLGPRPLVLLSW